MKEYRVEVVWGDGTQDSRVITAASDATAIAEAKALVDWLNKGRPAAGKAKLQAIYDFRGVLIAARF